MINKIAISNFKSVVNASFPLSSFNVMIGANGCGKSNVLEAIAIAAASSSHKLDFEYFANRGIRVVEPRFMLPAFEGVEAEGFRIGMQENHKNECEFDIRYNKNAKPPRWEEKGDTRHIVNFKPEADFQSDLAVIPCPSIMNFTIYSLEESILRKADTDNRLYPLGRHGEGLFAYLKALAGREDGLKIINEINENLGIIDWFDGMQIPDGQLSQEFNIKLRDQYIDETIASFDQRSTNEGFLYLLFYLTLILSDETPSFFAIENIDASFNPKLCHEVIARLAELAKKHEKQIIATTHNSSVLDGLDIMDNGQKLLVVRRNIDGYTKVNDVETKGNLNMPLSEAWVKGFIGGLPDNF